MCSVHYLIATFGSATGNAVLEIPVSVTGKNIVLSFLYRISSQKIELSVWKYKAGQLYLARFSAVSQQYNTGEWNSVHIPLSSDVEAVRLVAKKSVVTTAVEYVLVNRVKLLEVITIPKGTTSLFHYTVVCCYVPKVGTLGLSNTLIHPSAFIPMLLIKNGAF